MQLRAKGTGTLIIRLVKASVSHWESQYKTNIVLTNNLHDYSIPFSEFTSISGDGFETDDITSIVFTMLTESGEIETKEMTLQHLRFSTSTTLSVELFNTEDELNKTFASPNPMVSSTTIHFTSEDTETVELLVYNQIGSLIKTITHQAAYGKNEIKLNRGHLSAGLYFCKIESSAAAYRTTKLLIE